MKISSQATFDGDINFSSAQTLDIQAAATLTVQNNFIFKGGTVQTDTGSKVIINSATMDNGGASIIGTGDVEIAPASTFIFILLQLIF